MLATVTVDDRLSERGSLRPRPGLKRGAGSSPLRTILQVLLIVGVVILSLWTLYRIAAVLFILIEASLFAYVIAPLVDLAEHPKGVAGRVHRLPRAGAI